MDRSQLLSRIKRWGETEDTVRAILLVGSQARGDARPDSDLDLVILCHDPTRLIANVHWIEQFGHVEKYQIEDWGKVQVLRTFYDQGLEIEFGITSPHWAAVSVDEGTRKVISDGHKIILMVLSKIDFVTFKFYCSIAAMRK